MGCFHSRDNRKTITYVEDDSIETVEQIQAYTDADSFAIMQGSSFQYPGRYIADLEANYSEMEVKLLALEEVYYNMSNELKLAKLALKIYDKKMKLMEKRLKVNLLANGCKVKKHSYNLRDRKPKE